MALLICAIPLSARAQGEGPRLRAIWNTPVKSPRHIAVTPDGRFAAVIDKAGDLTYYDAAGRPLWRKTAAGATAVSLAANGSVLLTYTPLNPLARRINILFADGKVRWSQTVAGCVWSAAVSDDGAAAVVGAGTRRVYIFSLDRRLRYRRRTLPGIPFSVAFAPDGKRLVAGTWQKAGVGVFDLNGRRKWFAKGYVDLQYSAEVSRNGRYILARGRPNRPRPMETLTLWRFDGSKLWQKRLKLADVRTALSPAGDVVAISYSRQVIHGKGRMSERYLVLYDRAGRGVWNREKGGVFLQPELIAVFRTGRILVSSQGTLYLYDGDGRALSTLKLPASIRGFTPAAIGGRALIYCGDGRLYMFGQG